MAASDPVDAHVEAIRDDGAVMVTMGEAAAVVLPSGQVTYLPKDSVYARGSWTPAPAGTVMPREVDLDELAVTATRAARVVIFDEAHKL